MILVLSVLAMFKLQGQPADKAPHLIWKNGHATLMVHQKPFLMLGGELGNSTTSNAAYMRNKWPLLKQMKLNTVLAPVYWELIEPQEGKFDFSLLDSTIAIARQNNMHLVLLWFGTWKNSMSCYVPEWVKTNPSRFERTIDNKGKSIEILSTFQKNILDADIKAFKALMQHIKLIDAGQQTVVMVQVENEVGMLPTAREHTAIANQLFNENIPAELASYLQSNKDKLVPELKARLKQQSGTWTTVFGDGLATDEIFQAWYYAKFVNEVTKAGKSAYNIPMYVNAALNRPGKLPGEYPSAGPLPHIMDIWKAAAPAIDMLSPDFYNPNTKQWCSLYDRQGNQLFVPEMHFDASCAAKVFYIIGRHASLGFSPFSIENGKQPEASALQNSYGLIHQIAPLLNQYPVNGFLFENNDKKETVTMGKYEITFSHDLTLGWHPAAKDSVWGATGAIIIQTGADEFIIAGTGVVATFQNKDNAYVTNILSVDEGEFKNGKWVAGRRLNGDEDHQGRHVRITYGEWGIQKLKLYNTKQ